MQKIHISKVPVEHRRSPGGRFELHRRHISLALGGTKDAGQWSGGHPFDVEFATLPPGRMNYPLHSHAAQTEYYIILSGTGILHGTGASVPLAAGDHLICHPGEAHQIEATGTEPLTYFIIADHHRADITTYPHTGKRQLKPEYRVITATDADYYSGEE